MMKKGLLLLSCTLLLLNLAACKPATETAVTVSALVISIDLRSVEIPKTARTYDCAGNYTFEPETVLSCFFSEQSELQKIESEILMQYAILKDGVAIEQALPKDFRYCLNTHMPKESPGRFGTLSYEVNDFANLHFLRLLDKTANSHSALFTNPDLDVDLSFCTRESAREAVEVFLQKLAPDGQFQISAVKALTPEALGMYQNPNGGTFDPTLAPEGVYAVELEWVLDDIPFLMFPKYFTGVQWVYPAKYDGYTVFYGPNPEKGENAILACDIYSHPIAGDALSEGTVLSAREALRVVEELYPQETEGTLTDAQFGYIQDEAINDGNITPVYNFTVARKIVREKSGMEVSEYYGYIVDAVAGKLLSQPTTNGFWADDLS